MNKIKQAKKAKETLVTFQVLNSRAIYDSESGRFYKKERIDVDDCSSGYRKISVTVGGKRVFVKAHRAAFLLMTGEWPKDEVDHIDLDKSNNRWKNLRHATMAENRTNVRVRPNCISKMKGAHYRKSINKWSSKISINGKPIHLGIFDSPEKAHMAYCSAVEKYKKDFLRRY